MRRFAVAPLLAAAALLPAAPAGGGVVAVPRVAAGAGISVRVPPGWQLIRRRLTDVSDPAQRLAVTSFPLRLSPRACACGKPSTMTVFRAAGRVFQAEVFLGPAATARTRARMNALLDSLRTGR